MGKNKHVFHSLFKKTRYLNVSDVNFDATTKTGTCYLKSKHLHLVMVWTLINCPVELPNIPGAPYPVLCAYTIFKNTHCDVKTAESMSGQFIFEENSGTPPNNSALELPNGEYRGIAEDNNYDKLYKLKFSLENDCMEIAIKQYV